MRYRTFHEWVKKSKMGRTSVDVYSGQSSTSMYMRLSLYALSLLTFLHICDFISVLYGASISYLRHKFWSVGPSPGISESVSRVICLFWCQLCNIKWLLLYVFRFTRFRCKLRFARTQPTSITRVAYIEVKRQFDQHIRDNWRINIDEIDWSIRYG
jgi:hypothetical protein